MYLRPHPTHLLLALPLAGPHVPQGDCGCAARYALELPRIPGAEQPDGWGSPELLLERPSSALSGGGVTVTPGTGEAFWEGFAPEITTVPGDAAGHR